MKRLLASFLILFTQFSYSGGTNNTELNFIESKDFQSFEDSVHNESIENINSTYYYWSKIKELPWEVRGLFNISESISEEKIVLLVFSRFQILKDTTLFGKDFYRDLSTLNNLSGMTYKKEAQDSYSIKYSPIPFKKIKAKVDIEFPESNALQYLVLPYFGDSQFRVHLKTTDFNSDLVKSDILSSFQGSHCLTNITNFSMAILEEESESAFFKVKKKIMISTLKKQTSEVLNIYKNVKSQNPTKNICPFSKEEI